MYSLTKSTANSRIINEKMITSAVNTKQDQLLKSWHEIPGPSIFSLALQYFFYGLSPNNPVTFFSLLDLVYLIELKGQSSVLDYWQLGILYNAHGGRFNILKYAKIIAQMSKKYGPIIKFNGFFGFPTILFLMDGEAMSQILRNENRMPIRIGLQSMDYFKKKYYISSENKNNTSGLLTEQGETWKNFRSIVNPILLQPKTVRLYTESLEEVAVDMIKRIRLIRNEQNMLKKKFDEEMSLWALESIGVVAFGGRLNCLDLDLPEDSPAKQIIQTVHDIAKTTEEIDFKPSLWRYVATPLFRKAMNLYKKQMELSKFFIEKSIKQFETREKSKAEKCILEKLLDIDENVAVIMANDMLLAGIDTTANTITATLYLLAQYPEKQNKLRAELLSQKEKRPYLKACIKESMRILPVTSGNMRVTTKEYDILGYKIPKDMRIYFAHQFLSSKEENFPRAKEFIPERWITEKSDPLHYSNAHPLAFSPFGFGVRSCIGRRIAELEMETFLAKVIENFYVEWFGPPLKIYPAILNFTIAPFNFIFKDVK